MVEPALSSSDAPTAVRLRGVTKVYDNGTVALGPLDLDIEQGRIRLAVGLVRLRQIHRAAPDRRPDRAVCRHLWMSPHTGAVTHIGFVFQEPTLMPWSTVSGTMCGCR
jgi:NitT/TauT family transport system ATP-binding protein